MKGIDIMANQKTLDKKFTIIKNGVIIIETIENQLSKEELQLQKNNNLNKQIQLAKQISDLQNEYDILTQQTLYIDNMISKIEEETII
jgi:hypothetical protein